MTDPSHPPPSRREWLLLASAYATQFVASSFFSVALVAILRGQGLSLTQLGWIYLLGLVPGLKFLWAPLIDRYGFGRHGHYRAWLCLMQALLILTLAALACLDVRTDVSISLRLLILGCVAVALLTACQDIAADGLACRLLGPQQRGLGNALQMAGGMVGFAMGGGGVLMIHQAWGWRTAIACLIVINGITLALALGYREPAWARPARDAHDRSMYEYWKQLVQFWRRPDTGWHWALLIATVQAGVCMAYGVLTPMLLEQGWKAGKIGRVVNVYGSAISVCATLALGWSMRRWSPRQVMRWMLPAQVLAVLSLGVPLLMRMGDAWVLLGIAGYLALYMPLGVLISVLMMSRASARSPATDFSMQYGLYSCAGFLASALALPLAQYGGYGVSLAVAAMLCLLVCFLVPCLLRYAEKAGYEQSRAWPLEHGQVRALAACKRQQE
ncbi:MAG: MFS transporter [Brachymonas sp.]|nr:MFS transporter [Brachymonas sp.]